MNTNYNIPIPNTKEAPDYVFRSLYAQDEQHFYNKYTPQIISTNELPQLYELKNHVTAGAKVLTVSASGEQPLFFILYSTTGLDDTNNMLTFDISYNAYLLTCLKIAALQAFTKHQEYEQFVRSLIDHCKPQMLIRTPKIEKCFPYLSDIQKKHIRDMDAMGMPVFVDDITCQFWHIQQQDYEKLRQSVKSPLPFIWCDITELDKKLGDETFDFIYYSNILGFLHHHKVKQVLEKTKKHINPNGKLFLVEDKYAERIKSSIDNVFEPQNWNIETIMPQNGIGYKQFIMQRTQHIKG